MKFLKKINNNSKQIIQDLRDLNDSLINAVVEYQQTNFELKEQIEMQREEIERLQKLNDEIIDKLKCMTEENHKLACDKYENEIRVIKEFAEKITEIFVRYAHLHNYAEKARTETIESAEGEEIEMQSVWDVLSLKKYGLAEYEEMSELQKNIEIIAKERLLTELEKDFRLLKKEMVGESDA